MSSAAKEPTPARDDASRAARPRSHVHLERRLAAGAYAAAVLLLGIVAVGSAVLDQPDELFLVEPTQLFPVLPWYTGLVSAVGGMLWWAAGALWLLCAWVLRRWGSDRSVAALVLASVFSVWLGIDEMFVLHEVVLPSKLHVSELSIYAAYGALTVLYLLKFREFVASTRWRLLVLALVFFLSSTALDQVAPESPVLLEEGVKLLGIVTWVLFFAATAGDVLTAERPMRT